MSQVRLARMMVDRFDAAQNRPPPLPPPTPELSGRERVTKEAVDRIMAEVFGPKEESDASAE